MYMCKTEEAIASKSKIEVFMGSKNYLFTMNHSVSLTLLFEIQKAPCHLTKFNPCHKLLTFLLFLINDLS